MTGCGAKSFDGCHNHGLSENAAQNEATQLGVHTSTWTEDQTGLIPLARRKSDRYSTQVNYESEYSAARDQIRAQSLRIFLGPYYSPVSFLCYGGQFQLELVCSYRTLARNGSKNPSAGRLDGATTN